MSGGGGSAPATPSTTTQIQDIPAWEQGYVTDLLGQAQTIAAQPFQQFPGQQVAGFTGDQNQAFSNIENAGVANQANQAAALGAAGQGAASANNIYSAGSPYLQAATAAASPQGIQAYMSPYTNSVVQGLQDTANQNWNQNIMPGINDKFVGSGQYASGRNAQVLGQAAGNFQTGLSSNIANALESGYSTAGQQAQNQAANLLTAGTQLGNLASTQAGQQLNAGTTLGNLGAQSAATNLTQNQALQAVGQQQQQLNQTNLNVAQQNWQDQTNWPKTQTEYLNQIIRGLPAPSATTVGTQTTPAYSVSPLSGLGGAGTTALSLLGSNGNSLGTAVGAKKGGLIKKYAEGGAVDDDSDDDTPLGAYNDSILTPEEQNAQILSLYGDPSDASSISVAPLLASASPLSAASPLAAAFSGASASPIQSGSGMTKSEIQQNQLLALARGMLTPTPGGSPWAALGQGVGALQDFNMAEQKLEQAGKLRGFQQTPSAVREYQYFNSLSPEAQKEYLKVKRNPQYLNLGDKYVAPGTGETLTKGLSPEHTPEVRGAQEKAKKEADISTQAQADLPRIADQAQTAIDQINETLKAPGLESNFGMKGVFPNLPGSEAADAESMLKQIRGGVFLNAYNQLRGGGAITEIEGEKATDAYARMQKAQSVDAFKKAAQEYIGILKKGVARTQRTASGDVFNSSPASSEQNTLPSPVTLGPEGGKLIGTSKGKKVYELPDGSHVMEQ